MTAMTQNTEKFFHGYAADFNSIYGTESGFINSIVSSLFRKSMKERFVRTMKGCEPAQGKDVLDIGCGPGHYSVELARMGAKSVLGVDFAEGMLSISRDRAATNGVSGTCRFEKVDFFSANMPPESFDYVIVMGFMDYVEDPLTTIQRVMQLTREKAFFSFPTDGGFLAWQRKLRYRSRCPLYLYSQDSVEHLFKQVEDTTARIDLIHRDYFVTATKHSK